MEINRVYRLYIGNEKVIGAYLGRGTDNFWQFLVNQNNYETTELEDTSMIAYVPSVIYVNPAHVSRIDTIYSKTECKEYFVISEEVGGWGKDDYKVRKVSISQEQKHYIDSGLFSEELFDTKEEAEEKKKELYG